MRWSAGDGVSLDILAPSLPFLADTGDDVNENSIVAMLHYRNFRESVHGRRRRNERSAPFANAIVPRVAVISVGRHNTFGHPGPSTLATLTLIRATMYRTDHCGALTLEPDAVSTTQCRLANSVSEGARNAARGVAGAPCRYRGRVTNPLQTTAHEALKLSLPRAVTGPSDDLADENSPHVTHRTFGRA